LLSESKVSYIKWDMNRYMTEPFGRELPCDRQGEFMHRYILGVYKLYDRLTKKFPHVLFESCASGGARFDPGMLYYAPQTWTSDNSDANERTKIQYGTSYMYPIVSMGSHVSAVPNHQMSRTTKLSTRASVAYFGTFGYELDLNLLNAEEIEEVKKQVSFMKEHRELIQLKSDFYRLISPFYHNETAWIVVAKDKSEALAMYYQRLCKIKPKQSQKQGYLHRAFIKGIEGELPPLIASRIKEKDNKAGQCQDCGKYKQKKSQEGELTSVTVAKIGCLIQVIIGEIGIDSGSKNIGTVLIGISGFQKGHQIGGYRI